MPRPRKVVPPELPPKSSPKVCAKSASTNASTTKVPKTKVAKTKVGGDSLRPKTQKPQAQDQKPGDDQSVAGPGLSPQLIGQIAMLCQLGATDEEIGQFFGASRKALQGYKLRYPELVEAMQVGKAHADTRVERSLYSRAVGFTHRAVKIFYDHRLGEVVEHEYTEVHPPETAACIFWLKNRRPDVWRDAFVDATPPEEKARIAQEALQKLLAVEGHPVIDVQAKEVRK